MKHHNVEVSVETFIRNDKRLHGIVDTKRYRLNEIFLSPADHSRV